MTKNADTKFGSLSWVELVPDSAESPSSRCGHSLVYFEGCLYLFGGQDEYSASNELWQYHTEACVWTKLSYSGRKPPRLYNHSAVLYDRKFFVFGGSLGSSFSLWVFDFSLYEWEVYQTTAMWPDSRHSQSVAVVNNLAYMYGGYTYLGNESDELWAYDLDENEWRQVEKNTSSSSPPAMFGHTAVFSGPVMWIFGGSSHRDILDSLWSYDTESGQWNQVAKMFSPPPLYYHIAIVTGDVMLIYGGFDEGVKAYTGMWRFNFETEVWTQMVSTELPALAGHAVAISYVKSSSNADINQQHSLHSNNKNKNYNKHYNNNNNNKNNNNNNNKQSNIPTNNTLTSSTITVTALDNSAVSNAQVGLTTSNTEEEVVLFDKRHPPKQSFDGYSSQKMYPVTPGDIELRPMTTHSTNSADSHVSLPGMVDDDDYVTPDCDYPPSQRIYHSVYENRTVSNQKSTRPGYCTNNPLYDENIENNPADTNKQTDKQTNKRSTPKQKPSAITFYDTEVIGDTKQDHSDSGSQGSRSSLRKKKSYKRGCNTEFYIVGHGQETLPKYVVLYRCKIV
ncbi:hypothetical protein ACHWQZ_G019085 [Mnemiopsis leidyi]